MRERVQGFLKLPDGDLARELGHYLLDKIERSGSGTLSAPERVIAILTELEMEIANGGFDQYYWNSPGDHARECVLALRELGAPRTAQLVLQANSVFGAAGPHPDRAVRWKQMDSLPETAKAMWFELDRAFDEYREPLPTLAAAYVRKHAAEFTD